MMWCNRCQLWSRQSPCRHCSSSHDIEPHLHERRRLRRPDAPRRAVRNGFGKAAAEGSNLWVILLAAGEGHGYGDFSIRMFGDPIPKHFWSLDGRGGMLGWALARAARITPAERIAAITRAEHARWTSLRMREVPVANVVVEPADRGTAPGILLALIKIGQLDPDAVVVLLPCDHHVEAERILVDAISSAAKVASARPDQVVLFGAPSDGTVPEGSWIVPKRNGDPTGWVRDVACLVEQREVRAADRLVASGALVNTGIAVGVAATFLALFTATVPDLVCDCAQWIVESEDEPDSMRGLYESLLPRNFDREVLDKATGSLSVAKIPPCGWTDLGTPEKLRGFLRDRVIASPSVVLPGEKGLPHDVSHVPVRAIRSHAN
jgi:mannose-1-phosphate guanylyltransferase